MASMTQRSVILLMCWTLMGQVTAAYFTENILNVMSICNGIFVTTAQNMAGNTGSMNITGKMVPVNIPALKDKPVLYDEETINGEIYRMLLIEFTEDSNGVIFGTPYNFTDPRQYKNKTFNLQELFTVTPDDLHTDEDCKLAVEQVAPTVYTVLFPDCRHTTDKQHLAYIGTFTCNAVSFAAPLAAKEDAPLPRIALRHGERYPLIGAPPSYVSPCDKRE